MGGCVVALALTVLTRHPHYLSYFNELVGGPPRGHLYLADSNIDWGQDLKRLSRYAADHPQEKIKLSYFGMADPRAYGIDAEMLPSSLAFGPSAELTAGTYVISVTQLLGVYLPEARPGNEGETLWKTSQALSAQIPGPSGADGFAPRNTQTEEELRYFQSCLLISRLRGWEPDERIGWSLWVYRLTDADVARLVSPEGGVR